MNPAEVRVFFNFRSPYCYLASKHMFEVLQLFRVDVLWRPLSGWDGRSSPERAEKKLPLARQDVSRYARRMGIPFNPPPKTTDPTRAARGSLLAEERGLLVPYVKEVMRVEWAEGRDIGVTDVLLGIGASIGLDEAALGEALESEAYQARLEAHWSEAQTLNVLGVPTFVVGDEIFWGNDRIDFLADHLRELRLANL